MLPQGHGQPCFSEKQLTVPCSSQQLRSTMGSSRAVEPQGSFPQSKSYWGSGFWLPASENKWGRNMTFMSNLDVYKPGVEVEYKGFLHGHPWRKCEVLRPKPGPLPPGRRHSSTQASLLFRLVSNSLAQCSSHTPASLCLPSSFYSDHTPLHQTWLLFQTNLITLCSWSWI